MCSCCPPHTPPVSLWQLDQLGWNRSAWITEGKMLDSPALRRQGSWKCFIWQTRWAEVACTILQSLQPNGASQKEPHGPLNAFLLVFKAFCVMYEGRLASAFLFFPSINTYINVETSPFWTTGTVSLSEIGFIGFQSRKLCITIITVIQLKVFLFGSHFIYLVMHRCPFQHDTRPGL